MDEKVCLDTDTCISIVNQKAPYQQILESIAYSSTFVSTVSVFELFLRKTNIEQIETFINDIDILNFDVTVARKASEILKRLKAEGKMIDMRDLFIASTAIINGCKLATLNKKHFENIKELSILEL